MVQGLNWGCHLSRPPGKPSNISAKQACTPQPKAWNIFWLAFSGTPKKGMTGRFTYCNRCSRRAKATRHHIAYECDDNSNIDDKLFLKSKNFWKEANRFGEVVCVPLWYRGIVPYSARTSEQRGADSRGQCLWSTKNFDAVLAESKLGYSDGTRGVGKVPICIRPAAWGAITFKYCNLEWQTTLLRH